VLAAFRPITVAGLLIFVALTIPVVWVLARRLDASAAERERLLMAAVEASEAERRRIARDLHDGVVQDLAGISFGASATARELTDRPELAGRVEALGTRIRQSLRTLRSLLVEIYPPDLRTEGLAAALDDLVAPAVASGVEVELDVDDTSSVGEEATALTWRVAQEAVRNALRHGRPSKLSVRVGVSGDTVSLDVVDDGVGFDPRQPAREGHLGLRGLRDLITESGSTLTVESAPGSGTAVRLETAR
jgi:two-component system, NarL family, sensor kinase